MVGPSFSGKTYLMLKVITRIPNRYIYIITKSPPEQNSNSKIKIKEISDEIKPLNYYEKAIIFFDDNLGPSSSKFIPRIFIRSRHTNLDIYLNPILTCQKEQYKIIVKKSFCLIKH